jgi:hypothetical protein
MKSPAIFTLILVGAATTASAQPEPVEPSGRVSYTENQAATPPVSLPKEGDEIELASATPATHGTEFVVIGKESGAFSKLRIAAAKGRVVVRKVRIFFDDGSSKTVQVDTILDAERGRQASIDLKGVKSIDHVTVSTEPGHGSYVLYGTAAR